MVVYAQCLLHHDGRFLLGGDHLCRVLFSHHVPHFVLNNILPVLLQGQLTLVRALLCPATVVYVNGSFIHVGNAKLPITKLSILLVQHRCGGQPDDKRLVLGQLEQVFQRYVIERDAPTTGSFSVRCTVCLKCCASGTEISW